MAAVQMNVRLDSALKEAGDAVIARSGYTPSQIVRALWEQLALQDGVPSTLRHHLDQRELGDRLEQPVAADDVESGPALVSAFFRRFDIPEPVGALDYEALRDEAADEQMREWGLA